MFDQMKARGQSLEDLMRMMTEDEMHSLPGMGQRAGGEPGPLGPTDMAAVMPSRAAGEPGALPEGDMGVIPQGDMGMDKFSGLDPAFAEVLRRKQKEQMGGN